MIEKNYALESLHKFVTGSDGVPENIQFSRAV